MATLASQGLVVPPPPARSGGGSGVPPGMDPDVWASMLVADPRMAAAYRRRAHTARTTPLPYVLDSDTLVAAVRRDPAFSAALLPHLPPGQQDVGSLLDILRCPQLRQAAMSLTGAMEGRTNSASVFANFNLDPSVAAVGRARAHGDVVGGLLAAVQAKADAERAAAAAAAGGHVAPDAGPSGSEGGSGMNEQA